MMVARATVQFMQRMVRGLFERLQALGERASRQGAARHLGPMTSSLVSYGHWPDSARSQRY